jgi:hypothetical protein
MDLFTYLALDLGPLGSALTTIAVVCGSAMGCTVAVSAIVGWR